MCSPALPALCPSEQEELQQQVSLALTEATDCLIRLSEAFLR